MKYNINPFQVNVDEIRQKMIFLIDRYPMTLSKQDIWQKQRDSDTNIDIGCGNFAFREKTKATN